MTATTEKNKQYYETRLQYVKYLFNKGDMNEFEALVRSCCVINELVQEYQKIKNHNPVLAGAVENIHFALEQIH